jgi:hypothetical protein
VNQPADRDRGGLVVWLVVGIVVLLGLFLAVDRASVYAAQWEAARTIKSSESLSSTPKVKIHGFPVLFQVFGRHLDHVTVEVHGLDIGGAGRSVRIDSLNADMHNLKISSDLHSVTVASANAVVLVPYAELSRALGVTLGYGGVTSAGAGRVLASRTVAVDGRPVTVRVAATPVVSENVLRLRTGPVDNPAGAGGTAVVSQISTALGAGVPLSGAPFHLRITGVAVAKTGVSVSLTAKNLTFHR